MWDSSWCPRQRLNHLRSGSKDKTQLTGAKLKKVILSPIADVVIWTVLDWFSPPDTNIYQTGLFLGVSIFLIYLKFLVIFTFVYKPFLAPHSQKLVLTRLLHSGIFEKQTSGVRSVCERRRKPQAQVGTVLSASACDPRERTSPHQLIHQLTARTTAMTTCSIVTTVALVTCSFSNCHRSQQQAGHMGGSHTNCSHTATPPSPPPLFANRTPQLGGKNSTFRWTFWVKHPTSQPPLPPSHTHSYHPNLKNVLW